MAMGRWGAEQAPLFVTHQQLRAVGGHPFYEALERVLRAAGFDAFVEARCAPFYAATMGRPSVAPGVYFRCLLVGYFEGLDSERGIAWRVADSLSLRRFLGLALDTPPPDHSTLSRTRRRLALETHGQVFTWVLGVLATAGLVKGQTVGVDATTLEANAALRSIVRREDGQSYEAFLTELAHASGIETAYSDQVDRPFRSKSIVESDHGDRVGAKRRWALGYLADFGSFFKDEFVLRTDSPESLIRCASWTSRSQIESAAVSSPITPCQRSGSS